MLLLDYLLEQLPLLAEDREMLRRKRGFSDATIDAGKFRSCGQHVKPIFMEAAERYGLDTVAAHGLVMTSRNGQRSYVWHRFVESGNIIIPYFNDGACTMLRPHKWTPPGVVPQVYFTHQRYDQQRITVMAESEFKARASEQYGFPAFGLPGISSFGGAYFEGLAKTLLDRGVHNVVVLFDNEDKSSPKSPRYKKTAKDRWETPFWAYSMARQLNEFNERFNARVAWIPNRFRDESGKADIDGLLAAGVGIDEYAGIVQTAKTPQAFFDGLPAEAQQQLGRRIARRFEQAGRSRLHKSGGRYLWIDGENDAQPVSNFTAEYVASIIDEEGNHSWDLKLVNTLGREARIICSGRDAADHRRFRELCANQGLFFWSGKNDSLQEMLTLLVPEDERVVRVKPAFVGWDEDLEHYLFTNCAVTGSGDVVEYQDDGTIPLNGENWRLVGDGDLPEIEYKHGGTTWNTEGLHDLAVKLHENFGVEDVVMALAWMCAACLKPWLFPINRTFPILFIFGQKSSGKTRLMQWLSRIFFESGSETLISQNSGAFIRNRAAQMPYLPLWMDEFRNSDQSMRHMDMLRGIYDHSNTGISGGTIGTNKVFNLKCGLVISGEDEPDDPRGALNERMVTVRLKDKPTSLHFNLLEQLQHSFNGIFVSLLRNRGTIVERIKAEYDRLEAGYRTRGVSGRVVMNYALIHAVAAVVLDWRFSDDVIDGLFQTIRGDNAETNPLLEVLSAVAVNWPMMGDMRLNTFMAARISHSTGKPTLVFNVGRCWEAYAVHAGRTRQKVHSRITVRRLAENTPWVSEEYPSKVGGTSIRVREIDLDHAPSDLTLIANTIADDSVRILLSQRYGNEQGILFSPTDII